MVTMMRMVRTEKGYTIRDLAHQNGFSVVNLNRLDLGQGYCPAHWRKPLAEALNVPASSLFDKNGWPLLVNESVRYVAV